MLNQQRVFAGNLIAARDIGYFDQQCGARIVYRRYPTVDSALAGVDLGWAKA